MKLFWFRTEEALAKLDEVYGGTDKRIADNREITKHQDRLQLMLLSAIADALWSIAKQNTRGVADADGYLKESDNNSSEKYYGVS